MPLASRTRSLHRSSQQVCTAHGTRFCMIPVPGTRKESATGREIPQTRISIFDKFDILELFLIGTVCHLLRDSEALRPFPS